MPTGTGFVYVPSALYDSYITQFVPQTIALGEMAGMTLDEATATYMVQSILRKIEDYPDVLIPRYYAIWRDGDTDGRCSFDIGETHLFKVSSEVPSLEQLNDSFLKYYWGTQDEISIYKFTVVVNEELSQQYPGVYLLTRNNDSTSMPYAAVVYSADEFSNLLGQPVEAGIYFRYHDKYNFVTAMSNDADWVREL